MRNGPGQKREETQGCERQHGECVLAQGLGLAWGA